MLLLNTVLTVDASKAHSHAEIGWEKYTGECIRTVFNRDAWIAWLLWGKPAQEQFDRATGGKTKSNMFVVRSEHPAYASYQRRRWQCDNCFNRVNEFLSFHNQEPIKWV